LAMAGREVVEVAAQVAERAVPEGIVGQTYKVEVHALGEDVIVEELGVVRIAPTVDMNHDLRSAAHRRALPRSRDAGFEQRGKLGPPLLAVQIDLALGPEHTRRHLV